jgi:signal transduction histidine kinase
MPFEQINSITVQNPSASYRAKIRKLERALAEETSRRRRIVSEAANELATALQGISATFEILKISSDAMPLERQLDRAMRFFNVAETKLDCLRHYALRGEASTKVEPQEFFPSDVITDLILAFEDEALRNQQRLSFRDESMCIPVNTDRVLYYQIIANLILNAIRHSGPGTISILAMDTKMDGQPYMITVVEDNGPGISGEDQRRIFEPYYRCNSNADSKGGGAGMGLAIAFEATGLLGGQIDLESELGLGTTFTVRLPAEHPTML